ncbi:MAG: hypothetical protein ABI443_00110 [Chthoniobacterales bacterium]
MNKSILHLVALVAILPCTHAIAQAPAPQSTDAKWPPALRGADKNGTATVTSKDFLKVPPSLEKLRAEGKIAPFTVAKTAPTVEVAYQNNLPNRANNGTGWTSWGDIAVASDGKVYVGIGNHGSNTALPKDGGGYTFLYCWNPATKTLKQVVDINKLLDPKAGDPAWSKMHARILEGKDKKIYFTLTLNDGGLAYKTKWTEHIPGGQLFQYDPETGKTKLVASFPGEVTPTTLMDTERNIFYGNFEGKTQHSDIALTAFDLGKGKVVYQSKHDDVISSRNFALARDGKLYFNGKGGFWKYDPDTKAISFLHVQIPVAVNSGGPTPAGALVPTSILNFSAFVDKLKNPQDALSKYLRQQLTPATIALLDAYDTKTSPANPDFYENHVANALLTPLLKDLNTVLENPAFYSEERFTPALLTPQIAEIKKQTNQNGILRANRMLLVSAMSDVIATDQSQWMRSSTPETKEGYIYGTTTSGGQLFRFSPSKNEIKILGENFAGGLYTPVTILSPDEKYLYFVPGGHGPGADVDTPLVQYNIATGERKVIAFLRDVIAQATGYAPSGTFGAKISADGSTVYINFNGDLPKGQNTTKHSEGFGLTGFTAIHIPASERQ